MVLKNVRQSDVNNVAEISQKPEARKKHRFLPKDGDIALIHQKFLQRNCKIWLIIIIIISLVKTTLANKGPFVFIMSLVILKLCVHYFMTSLHLFLPRKT